MYVWDFLRTFSVPLKLSPFAFGALRKALLYKRPNSLDLVTEVYSALLGLLLRDRPWERKSELIAGLRKQCPGSKRRHLHPLTPGPPRAQLLTPSTWPEVLRALIATLPSCLGVWSDGDRVVAYGARDALANAPWHEMQVRSSLLPVLCLFFCFCSYSFVCTRSSIFFVCTVQPRFKLILLATLCKVRRRRCLRSHLHDRPQAVARVSHRKPPPSSPPVRPLPLPFPPPLPLPLRIVFQLACDCVAIKEHVHFNLAKQQKAWGVYRDAAAKVLVRRKEERAPLLEERVGRSGGKSKKKKAKKSAAAEEGAAAEQKDEEGDGESSGRAQTPDVGCSPVSGKGSRPPKFGVRRRCRVHWTGLPAHVGPRCRPCPHHHSPRLSFLLFGLLLFISFVCYARSQVGVVVDGFRIEKDSMLALPPVPVEMDSSSDDSSEGESDSSDSSSEEDEDIDKYERIARRRVALAAKKERERELMLKEKRREEREEYNEDRDAALAKRDAVLAKRHEAAAAISAAIKASDKDALEVALELGVNAGLEGGTRGKKWHTKEMAKGRFAMKQLVVRAKLAAVDANAEQDRAILKSELDRKLRNLSVRLQPLGRDRRRATYVHKTRHDLLLSPAPDCDVHSLLFAHIRVLCSLALTRHVCLVRAGTGS